MRELTPLLMAINGSTNGYQWPFNARVVPLPINGPWRNILEHRSVWSKILEWGFLSLVQWENFMWVFVFWEIIRAYSFEENIESKIYFQDIFSKGSRELFTLVGMFIKVTGSGICSQIFSLGDPEGYPL